MTTAEQKAQWLEHLRAGMAAREAAAAVGVTHENTIAWRLEDETLEAIVRLITGTGSCGAQTVVEDPQEARGAMVLSMPGAKSRSNAVDPDVLRVPSRRITEGDEPTVENMLALAWQVFHEDTAHAAIRVACWRSLDQTILGPERRRRVKAALEQGREDEIPESGLVILDFGSQ